MIFELVKDFSDVLDAMPKEHPRRRILKLLDEAIRRDVHFIDRHPTTLFQCLWNTCWWYDCPEAAKHYEEPEGGWQVPPPWQRDPPRLFEVMEEWIRRKERATPAFRWLRSRRPPSMHLGTALRAVMSGHTEGVNSVAFSPDGRKVVSGSDDKTVRIWDVDTGKELLVLRGHTGGVSCVACSPDGLTIVSGSCKQGHDYTLRVWDADSGRELTVLGGHERWVNSVDYSPDGRRIASGSYDSTVRVWDAHAGTEAAILRGHSGAVLSIAFSPDGRRVVSGGYDKTVRVWDTSSGTELAVNRAGAVNSVAFSPDGNHILGSSLQLHTWDAATGRETARRRRAWHSAGSLSRLSSIKFSADGRHLAGGHDSNHFDSHRYTVQIWDAERRTLVNSIPGHPDKVTSVAFSPDGESVVSGSKDGTVRLWRIAAGAEANTLRGVPRDITSLTYSPDGRRILSWHDAFLSAWDAETGEHRAAFHTHTASRCAAYSPNGRQIVGGSGDNTVRVWDAETGDKLSVREGHEGPIKSVAYSPDGRRIVSGSVDATVRVWKATHGAALAVFRSHERAASRHSLRF